MDYNFHDLKKMKATELKEIAKGIDHDAVHGYTTMNKDHLVIALCKALNIEMHEHHEVVGLDKIRIKSQIRILKKDRDKAIEAKNHNELKVVRTKIKKLKHELKKATV